MGLSAPPVIVNGRVLCERITECQCFPLPSAFVCCIPKWLQATVVFWCKQWHTNVQKILLRSKAACTIKADPFSDVYLKKCYIY